MSPLSCRPLPALEHGSSQALDANLHPPPVLFMQELLPCGQRDAGCSSWPHPGPWVPVGPCLAGPWPSTQVETDEATLTVWVKMLWL